MDEFLKEFALDFNVTETATIVDLIVSLLVSFVLTAVLSKVYIVSHSGYSYSRSFVLSLTLISITIALIMIIIGSNIARAFALVGAMSIVRFRNPVKDARDLVFVFMAIAIGMAAGTKFYSFAVIFTVVAAAIILGYDILGFGIIKSKLYVLRIRLNPSERHRIEEVCRAFCDSHFVISMDKLAGERDVEEVIYETQLKKKHTYQDLVDALGGVSDTISISLLVGESSVEA